MTVPARRRLQVFPFFVGSGRSGTTLVRAVFDSHPDLAIPDEVSFVIRYARPHYAFRYGWPRRFDAAACTDLILANTAFRRWGLPRAEVVATLSEPPARDFPDAVRRLYALWASSRGKARYGDKTPMHVLHITRLARMFPEARFVHVIRDGRDVAMSYVDVTWGPSTIDDAAVEWRRRVSAGRRAGRRLGPDRYREIRYEHLVEDPERVVREVCGFIELPWDESLLRYHERAGEVISATRFPDAHQRLRLPPTPGLRDWRREMDPGDVSRFEAIAGPLLEELGYGRAATRPTVAGRIAAGATVASAFATRTWAAATAGARVLTRQVSGRR
ncbi:MAG: sulfotransferase family protein [Jiangellaceae bacterium]